MNKYEQILEKAVINIQCLDQFSLFRIIIYQFELTVMEELNPHPQGMEDPRARTAQVHWFGNRGKFKIEFAPEFLDRLEFDELKFVILHEMLHVLHLHRYRLKIDYHHPIVWNLACDHVINSILKADIDNNILDKVLKTPTHAFIIPDLASKDVTVEEVYEFLMKGAKENENEISLGGSGQGTAKESQDGTSIEINQNGNKSKVPKDTANKDKDESSEDGKDSKQKAQQVKEEVSGKVKEMIADMATAKESTPALAGRGNTSSRVLEMLNELLEVHIPLDQLLERAICQKLRPSVDNRSWKTLNPFYRTHGIKIAGRGEELALDSAVFVLDTSGSMSNYDVKEISSAVVNAFSLFNSMTIIKHDHSITSEVFHEGVLDEHDLKKVTGRGGTSHQEVFDRIQTLYELGEHGIGIVMLATDYGSDIEELVKNVNIYSWVEEIPIQVILPSHQKEMIQYVSKNVDPRPLIVEKPK